MRRFFGVSSINFRKGEWHVGKRDLTPKAFLRQSFSSKITIAAFLQAHRDFLTTGELTNLTTPIYAKIDSGETLPNLGLEEIQKVIVSFIIAKNLDEAEKKLQKQNQSKAYIATIYNEKGEIAEIITERGQIKDLILGFEDSLKASHWVDRRLFIDGGPNLRGEISCDKLRNEDGSPYLIKISREEALARILRNGKAAASKRVGIKNAPLSNKMRARNDHFNFSHG